MTTTFDRLCAILAEDYKVAPALLVPEATLTDLGIDSLGTVELLWTVEDVFKIALPSQPIDLATLGDVVGYIDGLVAAQQALSGAALPESPTAPALRPT